MIPVFGLTYAFTHTHTQLFYGSLDFVRDNPGEPVPEETFTHSHPLWSSNISLLPPSTAIHRILSIQSMRFTVFFHNLSPSFLWSTSWPGAPSTSYSIHFFTQSLSSFHSTCCSTEIMSSNRSLSLNSLLLTLSCSFTPHIHLTILISALWSATSFSFLTGPVSLIYAFMLK